jgi:hypothetical protein
MTIGLAVDCETMMSPRKLILIVALAALSGGAKPAPVLAQQGDTAPVTQANEPGSPPPHTARRRITINPRPLLYRRCVDWYELQNRPSGTVLYPQMRCWWVRG